MRRLPLGMLKSWKNRECRRRAAEQTLGASCGTKDQVLDSYSTAAPRHCCTVGTSPVGGSLSCVGCYEEAWPVEREDKGGLLRTAQEDCWRMENG